MAKTATAFREYVHSPNTMECAQSPISFLGDPEVAYGEFLPLLEKLGIDDIHVGYELAVDNKAKRVYVVRKMTVGVESYPLSEKRVKVLAKRFEVELAK